LLRAAFELDAAVHVFRVLAEDDHVDLVRPRVRRLDTLEVAHRADAGVQVKAHPQVDVDAAEAAADGRRQWALEAQAVVLERFQRVVREVEFALFVFAEAVDLLVLHLGIVHLTGHVASVNVEPLDLALALVRLGYRGVENADGTGGDAGRAADVAADAVAAE